MLARQGFHKNFLLITLFLCLLIHRNAELDSTVPIPLHSFFSKGIKLLQVKSYIPEHKWYFVEYEDDDNEELVEAELLYLLGKTKEDKQQGSPREDYSFPCRIIHLNPIDTA